MPQLQASSEPGYTSTFGTSSSGSSESGVMDLKAPRKPSCIVDSPIGDDGLRSAWRDLVRYVPCFNDCLGVLWLMTLLCSAGISSCTATAPRGTVAVPMNRSAEPASAQRDMG